MDHPIKLVHGLPRKELIEKLTFHRRQGEVAERAVGFYLLDMQERHAYRPERDAARWAPPRPRAGGPPPRGGEAAWAPPGAPQAVSVLPPPRPPPRGGGAARR